MPLPHQKTKTYSNLCSGALCAEVVKAAMAIVASSRNYMAWVEGDKMLGYIFNSSEYRIDKSGAATEEMTVTKTRVRRYNASLRGELDRLNAIGDIRKLYLSLYRVRVDETVTLDAMNSVAHWSVEQIRKITSKFSCECEGHFKNGSFCSHIVARFRKDINLKAALTAIPVRKTPEKPAKMATASPRRRGVRSSPRRRP
ncbi:hypothetical protein SDRG_14938 [Saprolegnia diclina VS20]|uniref:SWIM-type domain-containing protein n=1 Tax=Saprolegnia diclina (strain VS20) TaxID=1156394 RepID=T0PY94_SAPDV|nr:hypothetical protein SDRG_14938 [Saprolegnia diclina VS20]EQC27221.1 hypothetical protein SDRG_14938 [Saprolegnia diclina VS20]|eukprot:XP_008619320.1 hypothetical protein SDRG_14938 [Saprolegnia diclina VS20]